MAPKKRKRTLDRLGSTPATPIRVTCPACQKEVPSFFVNSHLDLECQSLKSCTPSGRRTPSPAARPDSDCNTPSSDQPLWSTSRMEETISNISPSLEDEKSIVQALMDIGEEEFIEEETDEDITTGIAVPQGFASYDEDPDNFVEVGSCIQDAQSEMSISHSVRVTNNEPDDICSEENCSSQILSRSPGILLPNLRWQHVPDWNYKGARASVQSGTPGHLVRISGCFPSLSQPKLMAPKGLQVVENFITAEEEEQLLRSLDTDVINPWKLSRTNGIHQGKAYGNHIYGDAKRRVVSQVNSPMPNFVLPYVKRMRDEVPALRDFFPNEMNSIDYRKGDGHYLKAHMDDRQLSGKILVNLSLAGGCFMTYARELGLEEAFRVKLSPRSLQILTGESRYRYTHGIHVNDIMDPRRVSMTFRQSVDTTQNIRPSRQPSKYVPFGGRCITPT